MKPHRYNIFKRTHQCLSSMVYETGSLVRRTDFTNAKDAHHAFIAIEQTIRCFEFHTEKEAPVIYGSLIHMAPFIIATVEKANDRDRELAAAIENKIREYTNHTSKDDLGRLGEELQSLTVAFSSAVLQLIYKEETVVNELLWSCYEDAPLVALEAQITDQLVGESYAYTGRILMCLTNKEIVDWISGLIDNGYSCAAEKMIGTVKTEFPIERSQLITKDFAMQRA